MTKSEEKWEPYTLIIDLQEVELPCIKKVDHDIAEIGDLILCSIKEAIIYNNNGLGCTIKNSHIFRNLKDDYIAWVYLTKEVDEIKYPQIVQGIQKMNNLIASFYDKFIRKSSL